MSTLVCECPMQYLLLPYPQPSFLPGSLHLGHGMHSVALQEAFSASFPHPTPGNFRDSLGSSLSLTRTPATYPTQTTPCHQTLIPIPTSKTNVGDHAGIPIAKSTLTLLYSASCSPPHTITTPRLSSNILSILALHLHSNDATIPPLVAFPRQRASSGHKAAVRPCSPQGGDSPTERYPRMTTFR